MKTKNIIACLLLLLASQAVSAQNNAEALIRMMVNQMKSHDNMELTFQYQFENEGKATEAQQGKGWLQGQAYKVEMAEQQTICDGETIWTYLIEEGEVMISNATDGVDNTPLKVLTSLDENYAATLTGIDEKGVVAIELANPKGPYRRVTLRASSKLMLIKSLDVYTEDGTKLLITIDGIKYDQELGDKFFTFDKKKYPKVDIIDMR